MDLPQSVDATKDQSRPATFYSVKDAFRAGLGQQYAIGQLVKLAAADSQVFPDFRTVIPTAAAAAEKLIVGIISEDWRGMDGQALTGSSFLSGAANARGSQFVKVTVGGFHPSALIDNSDATAAAITNGAYLQSSKAAVGKLQQIAAPTALSAVAWASLPAAGIGSSLGAGAVTQASQSYSVTGVPATGDVYTVTYQIPYLDFTAGSVGTAQTKTLTYTLAAADAASVTAAAAAIVVALKADATFVKYYTATSSVGVVTITALATNPFNVTWGGTNGFIGQAKFNLSGTVGNSLTLSGTVTGTGTLTVGGATLAGGAGYIGTCPIFIPVF